MTYQGHRPFVGCLGKLTIAVIIDSMESACQISRQHLDLTLLWVGNCVLQEAWWHWLLFFQAPASLPNFLLFLHLSPGSPGLASARPQGVEIKLAMNGCDLDLNSSFAAAVFRLKALKPKSHIPMWNPHPPYTLYTWSSAKFETLTFTSICVEFIRIYKHEYFCSYEYLLVY